MKESSGSSSSLSQIDVVTRILTEISTILNYVYKATLYKDKNQITLFEGITSQIQIKLDQSLLQNNNRDTEIDKMFNELISSSPILKRFRCRLLQIILLYRQRANSMVNHTIIYEHSISKIEQQIFKFEQGQTLPNFLTSLTVIFVNHLKILNKVKNSMELNPQKISLLFLKQQQTGQNCFKVKKSKSMIEESEQQKKKRNTLVTLNNFYLALDCNKTMGLDYEYFRNSYFETKNNYDCLYEEMMSRNKNMNTNKVKYEKQYKQYRTRREKKKQMKKIKIMNVKQVKDKNKIFKTQMSVQRKQTIHSENSKCSFDRKKSLRVATQSFGDCFYETTYKKSKFSCFQSGKNQYFHPSQLIPQKAQISIKQIFLTPKKIKIDETITKNKTNIFKKYGERAKTKKTTKQPQNIFSNLPILFESKK